MSSEVVLPAGAAEVVAGHYRVLDTYRFFAASGVVVYHFEAHYHAFVGASGEHLVRLQQFVDFFFVLSGFVIAHAYGTRVGTLEAYGRFLWKRFARLYPLHLATVVLCAVLFAGVAMGLHKVHDPRIIDLTLVPANLLLLQAWGVTNHPGLDSPSWSLSAEMFAYLLFPMLALLVRRLGVAGALLVAAALALTVEVGRSAAGLPPGTEATYDFGMLRAVPPFLAGMAMCVAVERTPRRAVPWIVPHALAVAALALMLLQAPAYCIIALFPPLVALIAMAERSGAPSCLSRPFFVLLGNASYAVYLLHSFVQIASVSAIRAFHVATVPGLLVVGMVSYAIIVAIAVASFLYLETPARLWLNRRDPFRRGFGSARAA